MYTCGNCSTNFDDNQDALVVTQKGQPVAAICPKCTGGVRVAKLVLRRDAEGQFGYDQYTALEMQSKAFGKAHGQAE